jgi:tetratricopeptide (TPR) repeat protein
VLSVRTGRIHGGAARIVADYYAQEGRWAELVTLLGRELVTQDGVARIQALRRIARIYRHYLHDPASAEQALRAALAQPGDDEATQHDRWLLHGELVTCLEMQGRYAEAVSHLEGALAAELRDDVSAGTGESHREGALASELRDDVSAGTGESHREGALVSELRDDVSAGTGELSEGTGEAGAELGPERAELLLRLGRLARDGLDDEGRAVPAFAALLRAGAVPADGLMSLARAYRGDGRDVALAGVLRAQLERVDRVRERAVAADLQRRLAELLAGPLQRGAEAAGHYLAAYLTEPGEQAACGARARALLAGMEPGRRVAAVAAALGWLPATRLRAVRAWTLAGEAALGRSAEEAVPLFRAALASCGVALAAGGEVSEGAAGGEVSEGTGVAAGGRWLKGQVLRRVWRCLKGQVLRRVGRCPKGQVLRRVGRWLKGAVMRRMGCRRSSGSRRRGSGGRCWRSGAGLLGVAALVYAAGRRGLADAVAIDCAVLAAKSAVGLGAWRRRRRCCWRCGASDRRTRGCCSSCRRSTTCRSGGPTRTRCWPSWWR